MIGQEKLMRTVRVRNEHTGGTLGRLVLAISAAGGDVGSVRLIQETLRSTIRDITIFADDEAQLAELIAAIEANPGTHLLSLKDSICR